jgi:hypothetical protein
MAKKKKSFSPGKPNGNKEEDSVSSNNSRNSSSKRSCIPQSSTAKIVAAQVVLCLVYLILYGVTKDSTLSPDTFDKVTEHLDRVKNDTQRWLQQLNESFLESNPFRHFTEEVARPGVVLRQQGAKKKYPIILVPGFVTSGKYGDVIDRQV